MALRLIYLYGDLMNLYGDRGNIIALQRRCSWRGIELEVVEATTGDRIDPARSDLFFFFYHDTTYMPVDRAQMDKKLFAALKPGGFLIVADHSAKPGEGTSVGKTNHRIEESTLRGEVEAAGFKLVDSGDFLRHPEDPRDFNVNRPTGPVDNFVLKFQKPN